MRQLRLRTKFLLSLLAISLGLTTATLLIVRYSVEKKVRSNLQEELRTSVNTYKTFNDQRQESLTRSAELLANLPNVRALISTQDRATIQDASAEVQRQGRTDLLVLAGRNGRVLGVHSNANSISTAIAQEALTRSLGRELSQDWWFDGGHLYEVAITPIYLGGPASGTEIGFLVAGYEINEETAENFRNIAASDVAFYHDGHLVASTLSSQEQGRLADRVQLSAFTQSKPQDLTLGRERYIATSVNLSHEDSPLVSVMVLESVDKATQFIAELNRVLIALGLLTVIAGSVMVFLISHTFTRPLSNLVDGVRALEQGNFNYPLESGGGDEVSEVTGAFDRMRQTLRQTQEEQKQLEERLRQAHKMEAVGRLAGGVAHDFNNLLTIISGHGDLLQERVGNVPAHLHSVEQIQKAAGRAVAMTRQLLAFSRMQVLQPRVLDLNSIVADMSKMLPRLIGENIEFKFVADPQISKIKADPGQIEQVILNLVVNARDAMPDGGAIVVRTSDVTVEKRDALKRAPMPAGKYVLLSVSDTGHGMSEETKTHIFEPFFTTKEIGKGTGLGLATVYGVVKQSGAFIWVESQIGNGTTFEIYFPPVQETVPNTGEEKRKIAPTGSKEMILVVEDEAGVRELTCEFLQVSGYQILQAKDGVEALEIARHHTGPIALMLTDIVMPRMSGRELASRFKTIRPETKVIFMSGYSEYVNPGAKESNSEVAVLQKPFSISSLLDRVREMLEGIAPVHVSEPRKDQHVPTA